MLGMTRPFRTWQLKFTRSVSIALLSLCAILCWYITTRCIDMNNNAVYLKDEDELSLLSASSLSPTKQQPCTMVTCFDFSLCTGAFKIFVYPEEQIKVSLNYGKILEVVLKSRYYTSNPKQACLFLPRLDPLDRDRLSTNYQKQLEQSLTALAHWNNGQNHLIFNLFSGTYPDYKDTLDINIGKAILVKASVSSHSFRNNFDISLPLFSKSHPSSAAGYLPSSVHIFPYKKKYLVSFKGKRYLKGFGSETRNALHKIHNCEDVLMLTTCKHGKHWREIQDQRCSSDNELYERYDYQEILHNSTFCLAPRGRRLGSFRLLESLSVSCIPVSLANGYQLPFGEVIDWTKALLNIDERQLYEVGLVLRSISEERVARYKQQNQFLWEAYFSSVNKIVMTVIEIMHQRVTRQLPNYNGLWNIFPGALVSMTTYSINNDNTSVIRSEQYKTFTAVLVVKVKKLKSILELARNISKCNFLEKIVVVWDFDDDLPEGNVWPARTIVVKVEKTEVQKFPWKTHVKTDAVFVVNNFVRISPEEVNLAFAVWRTFPHRIAGIFVSSHFWNRKRGHWSYTEKIGVHHNNGFSMVLLSAAFYHRYYAHLYTEHFPAAIQNKILAYDDCPDISMNFLVAHVTRLPPIKVLRYSRLRTKQSTPAINYSVKNSCFQLMADHFGYIPLLYSNVVFEQDHA